MAHRIVGQDGIEGIRGERQPAARVRLLKMSPRIEFSPAGEVVGVLDSVLIDVQPGDAAAHSPRHEQSRASRSAANFENVTRRF